ncbi:MAG TPA: hypothetical protein VKS82_27275 [Streptosporangiaceae bacterium]|nr:hypothetical protein [Streptosporangiaceae bacterium]
MMADYITVELRDAFGTVVASGRIEVDSDAITPADLVHYEDGIMVSRTPHNPPTRLENTPFLPSMLASDFVQDRPLNPALPWSIRIGLDT